MKKILKSSIKISILWRDFLNEKKNTFEKYNYNILTVTANC